MCRAITLWYGSDMGQIAYSYSRVSSMGQISGSGIARQIEKAEDYCKRNGLILSSETFSDEGRSAYSGEHLSEDSRLSAFIDAVKKGRVKKGSCILVEALDRLSREDIDSAIDLFRSILKMGIDVITLSDEKRYTQNSKTKLTDWITSIVYFDAANEYSRVLSGRVKKAWKDKQQEGKRNKPSIPSWLTYDKNSDSYSIIESKAEIVRRIFKEYLGGSGFGSIARGLNEDGFKTMTGKGWGSVNVKFILKSPSVVGEYHAKRREKKMKKVDTGIVHRNHYPVIISTSDFHLAQEKMRKNPSKRGRPQAKGLNLWDGLFKCGYCSGSVGLHLSKNLICWNSLQGACIRASWSKDDYELPLVLECDESIQERMRDLIKPDSNAIEALDAQISSLDLRMGNIMKVLEVYPDSEAVLKSLGEAESQKKALKEERSKVVDTLENFSPEFTRIARLDLEAEGVRLDVARYFRKNIEKIVVFSVGERGDEYRAEMAAMRKRGERGDVIGVRLKKKFAIEDQRFFEVYPKIPIIRGGERLRCYRVYSSGFEV